MAADMQLAPEELTSNFEGIQALILEEWPQVDAERLAATKGDAGELVRVLAEQTDHSKLLIRAQLGELQHVWRGRQTDSGGVGGVDRMLQRVETRLNELTGHVKGDLVPEAQRRASEFKDHAQQRATEVRDQARERATVAARAAEEKVHENLLVSLLIAVGFGFVLGLLAGTSRGR